MRNAEHFKFVLHKTIQPRPFILLEQREHIIFAADCQNPHMKDTGRVFACELSALVYF